MQGYCNLMCSESNISCSLALFDRRSFNRRVSALFFAYNRVTAAATLRPKTSKVSGVVAIFMY